MQCLCAGTSRVDLLSVLYEGYLKANVFLQTQSWMLIWGLENQ